MAIKIITVFLLFAFCSCTNSGSPLKEESAARDKYNWVSLPNSGSLIVYGVSGRQMRTENEIENARMDAARKVSMYHGVYAISENVQDIGPGFLDYYVDSKTTLKYDEELEKYSEKLVFDPQRDVFNVDGWVFVRFTYPAAFSGTINYSFGKDKNGRPEWTIRPPGMIGDFYAGVGFSGSRLRLSDTVSKSYESAIVSIVSRISTNIVTREIITGYQNQTRIQSQSSANLKNFLVLEIWIDPVSQAVWTLAAAQNAN